MTRTVFPVMRDANPTARLLVPWGVGVEAWTAYAKKYNDDQSAERIAERGGFGEAEVDEFRPGWRETIIGGETAT